MTAVFSDIVGRYVHLTVQDVAYRVYFEQAGQGVPVLLQHTAGSDGRQWRHLLEEPDLTARFRFVAYDLPFHGKSLPPTGKPWWSERSSLSQSFLVDFVAAMAAALAMEGGIYIGCSMGGHLAPDLALLRPRLFRAVIAVEGGLATHDPEPFLDYLSHPRASNEAKVGLMLSQMSPLSPQPFCRETAWVYSQGGPQVFRGDLDYYLGEHDLTSTAADIDTSKTQVHVMSGDYDWSATPERSRALADAIPGATYTRMTGVGHFPMSENPAAFKTYLQPILDGLLSAPVQTPRISSAFAFQPDRQPEQVVADPRGPPRGRPMPTCVIVARWAIRLSIPPSESASVITFNDSTKRRRCSGPPPT